jgi:hypothetical protein
MTTPGLTTPAQVDLAGSAGARPLRFPVRGRGLLPRLAIDPCALHFGGVVCGEWGDQLVGVTNACRELPACIQVEKGSPYWKVRGGMAYFSGIGLKNNSNTLFCLCRCHALECARLVIRALLAVCPSGLSIVLPCT